MGFWDDFSGEYESLFDRDPMYADALRIMERIRGVRRDQSWWI